MKKTVSGILISLSLFHSCTQEKPVYQNNAFSVYPDRVVQGNYTAAVQPDGSLRSDYESSWKKPTKRVLDFKFSLNGGDNERFPGEDHHYYLAGEADTIISPLYVFADSDPEEAMIPAGVSAEVLERDTDLTVRVDMRHVLKDFREKGYFTLYNGEPFQAEDFEGLYIAGSQLPLGWDFAGLKGNENFRLTDSDGDGIYEITLHFSKFQANPAMGPRAWTQSADLSRFPALKTDLPLADALYRMSLEELLLDVRDDSAFMAGAKWPGVWTRDISYAIRLSLALIEPEISRKSLMHKVSRDRIIQDTGTGGSWPVSTDRMTWALAADEIYRTTGDREWLQQAYNIIRNSAEDDLLTVFDPQTGLVRGESSFLDWREQSYPEWMDPRDIYRSMNLGTNAVHAETYRILSRMAGDLDKAADADKYAAIADRLSDSINRYLWLEDRGYYSQYLYGRRTMSPSQKNETLGEALTILFGIADETRAGSIVSSNPSTDFGTPCFYPQIPGQPPYHNNGIWPFVEGYSALAAMAAGNSTALEHSVASIWRAAALFLTNKENFVAESGDFMGTEINSDRQLWSVAADLAVVYRIFFGMNFTQNGLVFSPFIPENFAADMELTSFRYRNAELNISVKGFGSAPERILMDGKDLEGGLVPADIEGSHKILIVMNDEADAPPFSTHPVRFAPDTPEPMLKDNILSWAAVEGADIYRIYRNGRPVAESKTPSYSLDKTDGFSEYQVAAISAEGPESFLSEPLAEYPSESEIFIKPGALPLASAHPGYSGSGYIELTKLVNTHLDITVNVPENGTYSIDARYANGSGPINTNNRCAVRSLSIDGIDVGVLVFPQRGNMVWDDWGYTNGIELPLKAGTHRFTLQYLPHNENMNGRQNRANLDGLRLLRTD